MNERTYQGKKRRGTHIDLPQSSLNPSFPHTHSKHNLPPNRLLSSLIHSLKSPTLKSDKPLNPHLPKIDTIITSENDSSGTFSKRRRRLMVPCEDIMHALGSSVAVLLGVEDNDGVWLAHEAEGCGDTGLASAEDEGVVDHLA
jgi:hypothetical protein